MKDNVLPLSDMAGEIVAVSEGVKGWKVRDRVSANVMPDHLYGDTSGLIDGHLTEYQVVPAHSLVAIPAHLSYEEASALPCAAITAYNALFGGKPVTAGDAVLLLGTGGVAMFALQFAVAAGVTIIIASSERINYSKTQWAKEVLLATEGRGVDHVVETAGPGTIMQSVSATRFGGTISLIGDVTRQLPDKCLFGLIKHRSVDVRGIIAGSLAQFNDILRLMRAHPETTRPVVDKVFPFKDSVQAFTYLESQKHVGKVVIKVSEA
ncbi:NAD(P)-binding protein [Hymenopellis radicata]|nr:NAD(P)-binding protein [Hymenopellis radicata]